MNAAKIGDIYIFPTSEFMDRMLIRVSQKLFNASKNEDELFKIKGSNSYHKHD